MFVIDWLETEGPELGGGRPGWKGPSTSGGVNLGPGRKHVESGAGAKGGGGGCVRARGGGRAWAGAGGGGTA